MSTESVTNMYLPAQRTRWVRCRVRRYRDSWTDHERRDCSTTHAVITVYLSRKRWSWRPYQIGFSIGVASGDFFIEEVIEEYSQWIWKPHYQCRVLAPYTDEGKPQHEWWAARRHAIKAIAHARKRALVAVQRYGGIQRSFDF